MPHCNLHIGEAVQALGGRALVEYDPSETDRCSFCQTNAGYYAISGVPASKSSKPETTKS
jgi:hypothetical protein